MLMGMGGGGRSFLPTDISGCVLWLRSDLGVTKDESDLVSLWADQSGNGKDASGAANLPTWYNNVLNGKPSIRFNGTSTRLSNSTLNITGTVLTVFIVYQRIATAQANARILGLLHLDSDSQIRDYYEAGGGIPCYEGANQDLLGGFRASTALSLYSPHPGNGVPFYLASKWDGTNHTFYYDGTGQTPVASTGSFDTCGYRLGCGTAPALDSFINCDLFEIVIYAASLSDANRAIVETYLATRYGL